MQEYFSWHLKVENNRQNILLGAWFQCVCTKYGLMEDRLDIHQRLYGRELPKEHQMNAGHGWAIKILKDMGECGWGMSDSLPIELFLIWRILE